ncbi:MAG: transglutaminase domain-containing protein [Snowella sp.]|nr:transglutaminase domain-containing protein [Snowella sp.]
MATNKDYREWQRRRGQKPKPKRSFSPFWLLVAVCLGGAYVYRDALPDLASQKEIKALADAVTENRFLSSPLVLTKRVTNPVAGYAETLALPNAEQLDRQAASIQYTGNSVKELAAILNGYATTEAEKARLIYAWIGHHVAYDVQAVLQDRRGNLSPKGVLSSRLTICSGYANLYQALAQEMGLEAVIIEGYAKGSSYFVGEDRDINHAWNGVKVNGGWYLVDVTWGAGTIDNQQFKAKYNPYYFATLPDELIYSHFPVESQWQLLPTLYTRAEFDRFPNVSAPFFRDRLRLLTHNSNATISSHGRLEIRLAVPDNIVLTAQLIDESGNKLGPNYTFVQKQGDQSSVNVAFPRAGQYQLIIFSKSKQQEIYHQAIKYKIQSTASAEPFPRIYGTFTEKEASVDLPLKQTLAVNHASYFQLKVDEAIKVIVINKNTNKWTELTPSNGLFIGSVVIDPGKTMIAAQFPDSDKYWTLLEYN